MIRMTDSGRGLELRADAIRPYNGNAGKLPPPVIPRDEESHG
ncbi:hypothetical protein [Acetivibrio sp. MSJd-27]|nr:hypothetical protein [Acetivibrio sp. MSJd-27]